MKHNTVASVMTTEVVRARYGTPFKEVARLLAEHRISGLPVIDDGKVVGVISETDLMVRQAEPSAAAPKRRLRRITRTRGARRQVAKAGARTAGQLMTAPPVTARADNTIAEAARTMAQRRVKRLPVLDAEERLVGIVTRRDLLQLFLRPDRTLRDEVIQEVLVRTLWLAPHTIEVSADEGVITLAGRMERRSETEIAVSMARQVDGVVAVIDKLTYRRDDSHLRPEELAHNGVTENWLRTL